MSRLIIDLYIVSVAPCRTQGINISQPATHHPTNNITGIRWKTHSLCVIFQDFSFCVLSPLFDIFHSVLKSKEYSECDCKSLPITDKAILQMSAYLESLLHGGFGVIQIILIYRLGPSNYY